MSAEKQVPSTRRKTYFIRLAGSIVILAILCLLLPRERLLSGITRIPMQVWIAAFGFYLTMHMLGAIKWALVINTAGANIGYPYAIYCYYSGLFCSLWLPSLVGGDVVRAGLAFSRSDSKTGLVSGSILDRLADVAVLLGISTCGVLFLAQGPAAKGFGLLWRIAAVVAIVILLGLALFAAIFAVSRFGFLGYRYQRRLVSIRRAIRGMRRKPGHIILAVCIAIILQSSLVLLQAWLGEACGFHQIVSLWFFAWPLAKLSALVPISLGGLGVRESALVALLVPFGANAAEVVSVGLVFQVIVFGGGLLAGLVALGFSRFEKRTTSAAIDLPTRAHTELNIK